MQAEIKRNLLLEAKENSEETDSVMGDDSPGGVSLG